MAEQKPEPPASTTDPAGTGQGEPPPEQPTASTSIPCPECGKICGSKRGLGIHTAFMHRGKGLGKKGAKRRKLKPGASPTVAQLEGPSPDADISAFFVQIEIGMMEAAAFLSAYREGVPILERANKALRLSLIQSRDQALKLKKLVAKARKERRKAQ